MSQASGALLSLGRDGLETQRRREEDVRASLVAFGGEEVERVQTVLGQPERVEVDLRCLRVVNAAQVDDELAVDVDEDVIVAAEVEELAPLVRERGVKLDGEGIVVGVALVAE